MNKTTLVSALSRVGATTASKLKRLGITTAEDLLYYFPFRYEDYRELSLIKDLKEGMMVTVKGTIELINNRRSFKKRKILTEALVSDSSGSVRVVWFNQPFLAKTLHTGDEVFLSGTVKADMLGAQLTSPSYEKAGSEATHTARLVPMYPLTEGVTQKQVRSLVKQILPAADMVEEWLPEAMLEKFDLTPLPGALKGIHFPADLTEVKHATDRLKFDELFLLQLQAELARREQEVITAPTVTFHEAQIRAFVQSLPFTLTKTQKVAAWEILQDVAKSHPMNRLLSGDVGSGKTVVAALAMYNTALAGHQSILMVPTEILAEQHFASITKLLPSLKVALYTRTHHELSERGIVQEVTKKKLAEDIRAGEAVVAIGTQALLSDGVEFRKAGLVIVDEQHRFGVEQRRVIKDKGKGVHFLSMTATPIPRSLALMLYGDLDVSIINELPPGRKPIMTRLVEPAKREKAYGFIREQVHKGRQVFVVCPLIESRPSVLSDRRSEEDSFDHGQRFFAAAQDDKLSDKKSVMTEYEKLSKIIFPDLKVGFLHGKLKTTEKDEVMEKFRSNEIQILVSTSVIEVGVNIPNATVMMIEGAERFGLAQLHQFRGRVGRSDFQSYCLLFTDSDSLRGAERLKYFEAHHDGFKLAEKDLEMRGPGEVYGTAQSGMMQLRLAKLTDVDIIKRAREAAKLMVGDLPKYPLIIAKLREWEDSVHLE